MGNLNDSIKKSIMAFFLTLGLILLIGLPILFFVKAGKENADKNGSESDYVRASHWEEIPAAALASPVVQEEDESAPVVNVDPEDEAYTHYIETASPDSVSFGFAGDILFDDNYAVGNTFKNHGYSAEGVIGQSLLEKMRGVDVMMVNNEFPYSNGGEPIEGKAFTFRAKPESVATLNTMGVDIVGLANNHAYDYGQQAFLDTLTTLDNACITRVGGGRNIEEASHPVYYVTENGFKVAIICATQIERLSNPDTKGATESSPGVFRCLDDTLLLERVREAKAKDAYVIVFAHWGTESTNETDYLQNDQSREITEAGADVIIGAHPHVLQRIDYVNGKPVVFSLGNYIFNSKTMDTCMVILTLHTDGTVNLQMIPAIQSGCTVNEATGGEAGRILNDIAVMSSTITIDSNGYISPR
jgi:poly-gamma-glutamate synthesis protein (capsule biosynthesis protein)